MGWRLVRDNTHLNFIGFRKVALALSGFFALATVVLVSWGGLNFGIDFVGGTLVQVKTLQPTEVVKVRNQLGETGMEGLTIQEFGSKQEYLIRMPSAPDKGEGKTAPQKIEQSLTELTGGAEIRRVEFVGPQVGSELRQKGFMAIAASLLAILIYISMRFEFRYGVGALAALGHDVLLTVGVFALLGKEVTLPVLAALLTIIGYSLNDTIVVFDRIRENRRRFKKKEIGDVLNLSINEMLNRTLMTSLTTFIVLLALYILGREVIRDFAFTLMFGVIVGTYSSVFIASPVLLWLEKYYRGNNNGDNGEKKPEAA